MASDPCKNTWKGVECDSELQNVRKIVLDELNFIGNFDARSLCMVNSLTVLSLSKNSIVGIIPKEIGNCKNLTHLYLNDNKLSGSIPATVSQLNILKRLDISNNQLSGMIPDVYLFSLQEFNVSDNNLSGPIPASVNGFSSGSFNGNSGLCGYPLNACPPSAAPAPSPVAGASQLFQNKILFIVLFSLAILTIS